MCLQENHSSVLSFLSLLSFLASKESLGSPSFQHHLRAFILSPDQSGVRDESVVFSFVNWTESLFFLFLLCLRLGTQTHATPGKCSTSALSIGHVTLFFFSHFEGQPSNRKEVISGPQACFLRQVQISLHGLIILELLDEKNALSIACNFSMVSLHSFLLSNILISTQKLELSL